MQDRETKRKILYSAKARFIRLNVVAHERFQANVSGRKFAKRENEPARHKNVHSDYFVSVAQTRFRVRTVFRAVEVAYLPPSLPAVSAESNGEVINIKTWLMENRWPGR